jgi:5-methylcytosine-specific restriction endonuclease McrA
MASAPARKLQHSAREERPRPHVPSAVRDDVFVRDRGRCTFVGADGRVCGSTRGLQLDHIAPVARGGAGTRDNLRLLCAYHNRLEAARLMGVTGPRGDRAVSRSLPLRQ